MNNFRKVSGNRANLHNYFGLKIILAQKSGKRKQKRSGLEKFSKPLLFENLICQETPGLTISHGKTDCFAKNPFRARKGFEGAKKCKLQKASVGRGEEKHVPRRAVGIGDLAAHALQTEIPAGVFGNHLVPESHGGQIFGVAL